MERDAIVAWVRAASAALDLPAAAGDETAVVDNLARLAVIAEAMERFVVDPEVEPLTVFVR
jgi:hypothetical protein